MPHHLGSLLFTPAIKALQERYGSRRQYERMQDRGGTADRLGPAEKQFLEEADSFYMASVGATGWPYIQHRGGPKGFLKVIDEQTVAFADFRGNKQYISTGNLITDNRVALILVDYPRQARLKLLGRAEIMEGENAGGWIARLSDPSYEAEIERVFVIRLEAFDWNCQQHITPRFTAGQIREALAPAQQKITELEQQNAELRAEVARLGNDRRSSSPSA